MWRKLILNCKLSILCETRVTGSRKSMTIEWLDGFHPNWIKIAKVVIEKYVSNTLVKLYCHGFTLLSWHPVGVGWRDTRIFFLLEGDGFVTFTLHSLLSRDRFRLICWETESLSLYHFIKIEKNLLKTFWNVTRHK